MNLWHDVPAVGQDKAINVIIEIPCGSKNKYEIDKETGLIKLDRAMKTAQDYPCDYGFVPQTLWDDGDALDVIVLTTYPLACGTLVEVRMVGIMHMTDSGDSDDKLIAVPVSDPRWAEVQDITHVNAHKKKELQHFFETYKKIDEKEVVVTGFEGKDAAAAALTRAMALYQEKHSKSVA